MPLLYRTNLPQFTFLPELLFIFGFSLGYLTGVWDYYAVEIIQVGLRPPTCLIRLKGRGPRVVVSTAVFHASVRGWFPGLGGLKETKMFLPYLLLKISIVGRLRDRDVTCSASDRQGSNF